MFHFSLAINAHIYNNVAMENEAILRSCTALPLDVPKGQYAMYVGRE